MNNRLKEKLQDQFGYSPAMDVLIETVIVLVESESNQDQLELLERLRMTKGTPGFKPFTRMVDDRHQGYNQAVDEFNAKLDIESKRLAADQREEK
jgi:hypothetical protein